MSLEKRSTHNSLSLRPPSYVMRLSRLGSFHQTRLSFLRILLRRITKENWLFSRREFNINHDGEGHAIYSYDTGKNIYSLVAFAHNIPSDQRTDRVIATMWDATFCLYDGIPDQDDITRLRKNVPKQEAGRISSTEITLSRANRSVRLWDRIVTELANGQQPSTKILDDVGYLMRTTAVYGSGKFGAIDYAQICDRSEFSTPFQAEMLSVYLIRAFVCDMVDHMAHHRNPQKAVKLSANNKRRLGIGNSTGLGMAPYLINHPILLNNWISAKETALSIVRGVKHPTLDQENHFCNLVKRSKKLIDQWHSQHEIQIKKLAQLRKDHTLLLNYIATFDFTRQYPFDHLITWSQTALTEEGQELLVSLTIEPFGNLVDELAICMKADHSYGGPIQGIQTISTIKKFIKEHYSFVFDIDWSKPSSDARTWYISEDKLEPRLGERHKETDISDYEQPLQPARDCYNLYHDLNDWPDEKTIGEFLLLYPNHRHTVRRCQMLDRHPYGEIRDNTISSSVLPIDLLRAKLSFFGAFHFDPRSDRWVRINMFKGAPMPNELTAENCDDWVYPQ